MEYKHLRNNVNKLLYVKKNNYYYNEFSKNRNNIKHVNKGPGIDNIRPADIKNNCEINNILKNSTSFAYAGDTAIVVSYNIKNVITATKITPEELDMLIKSMMTMAS